MKEIKFRAWNKETGTMHPFINSIENWSFSFLNQDVFIWLQWTGLKDRLKKEIYEGDILCVIDEDDNLSYSVVEYGIHRREMASGWVVDIPGFSFVKKDGFKSFPIVKNYAGVHDLKMIEVAGNIYQNPELINQQTPLP